ncbi:hypothetical protein [Amycolatopsis sp. NPDC051128]|uniref:hypothetical protein n=1 Tax=Amycolatopsis sp. NPDC051128 TaxID=3155412 RepID=UPI003421127D
MRKRFSCGFQVTGIDIRIRYCGSLAAAISQHLTDAARQHLGAADIDRDELTRRHDTRAPTMVQAGHLDATDRPDCSAQVRGHGQGVGDRDEVLQRSNIPG